MSTGYRFYLMSGDHIVAVKISDCADDATAPIEADAILLHSPIRWWKSGTARAVSGYSASQKAPLEAQAARLCQRPHRAYAG